jgi:hypothetical protein
MIPFWKKERKIVNEFWLDFPRANRNMDQPGFLIVLHLVNSPQILLKLDLIMGRMSCRAKFLNSCFPDVMLSIY